MRELGSKMLPIVLVVLIIIVPGGIPLYAAYLVYRKGKEMKKASKSLSPVSTGQEETSHP